MLAILAAIGSTLLSTLAMVGASEGMETYYRHKANRKKLTANDIIAAVNDITQLARNKGAETLKKVDNALSDVQRKLNELANQGNSFYINGMGSLGQYIRDARSSITDSYNKQLKEQNRINQLRNDVTETMTKVDSATNAIDSKASILGSQSDTYKTSKAGKRNLEDIKNEAKTLNNQVIADYQNIEKKIGEN